VHSPLNGNPAAAIAVRPKQDINLRIIKMAFKHKYVDELETDPDIFVTLKPGYKLGEDFSQDGRRCQHCFGEDSIADVRRTLKDVTVCACDQCLEAFGKMAKRAYEKALVTSGLVQPPCTNEYVAAGCEQFRD
jgi:hypothetical protein